MHYRNQGRFFSPDMRLSTAFYLSKKKELESKLLFDAQKRQFTLEKLFEIAFTYVQHDVNYNIIMCCKNNTEKGGPRIYRVGIK